MCLQRTVCLAYEQAPREPPAGRAAWKQPMGELALSRPRYGDMRLHILLPQRKGGLVNRQKLYRLDYELVVMVRTKRRSHKASHLCAAPHPT